MDVEHIRQLEELYQQINFLGKLKEMAAMYGYDISRPAKMCIRDSAYTAAQILRAMPEKPQASPEGKHIPRLGQPPEKAEDAPDTFLLQEVLPAMDNIGDALMAQTAFQHLCLPVGAVEDGLSLIHI